MSHSSGYFFLLTHVFHLVTFAVATQGLGDSCAATTDAVDTKVPPAVANGGQPDDACDIDSHGAAAFAKSGHSLLQTNRGLLRNFRSQAGQETNQSNPTQCLDFCSMTNLRDRNEKPRRCHAMSGNKTKCLSSYEWKTKMAVPCKYGKYNRCRPKKSEALDCPNLFAVCDPWACSDFCSHRNLKAEGLRCNAMKGDRSGCLSSYVYPMTDNKAARCKYNVANGRCAADQSQLFACPVDDLTCEVPGSFRRRRSIPLTQDDDCCSQKSVTTDVYQCPSQHTCVPGVKQQSLYGKPSFTPSLDDVPATDFSASLRLEDYARAEWLQPNFGGVFTSWRYWTVDGPDGYMGAQIWGPERGTKAQFILSVWDGNRWKNPPPPKNRDNFQRSDQLVWPLGDGCSRNCQDCAADPGLKELAALGLSTGVKCELVHNPMGEGGNYTFQMKLTNPKRTINTKDFGYMPNSHALFDEIDRDITGAEWSLSVKDEQTQQQFELGPLLFEGAGADKIRQIRLFHEMMGCNCCSDSYSRSTRLGPFVHGKDGSIRQPTKMLREYGGNNGKSTCSMYRVTGDETTASITMEIGPDASPNWDGSEDELW